MGTACDNVTPPMTTRDALGLSYQPRQGWFYTYTDARDHGEYQVGPFPSRDAARDAALRNDESVAAHVRRIWCG